jgi:hypothetical protein
LSVGLPVTLIWSTIPTATLYNLQASESVDFSTLALSIFTAGYSYEATELVDDTTYYWRVRAAA